MKLSRKYQSVALCLVMAWFAAFQVIAQVNIDQTQGSVGFAGEHAGMEFSGVFERWQATMLLPTESAQASEAFINAEFDLSSATTGDATYDETLPEGDWFDVDNHPKGRFVSDRVSPQGNDYLVEGQLTLRGKTHPISFTLVSEGSRLSASFNVDRIAYAIGLDSDPEAEWVSRNIALSLDIPNVAN
ncbi:YceI family protein [Ningiella sp. W23]|uniref:YceI family protein n=1 Tax=Ningiella sp. W23 TaxID=3023715 RepID=UPI00375667C8